jgi:hypothetical protein
MTIMDEQIRNLKDSMYSLISNIITRLESTAQLFYGGNNSAANEHMLFLIEDLAVLMEGINAIGLKDCSTNIEELNEKLSDITASMEDRDYLLAADLMTQELCPLLKDWEEKLEYGQ